MAAIEQNATKNDNFIAKCDEVDRSIAFYAIENPSITDEEIAQKLKLSRQTVNRRRRGAAVSAIVEKTLALPKRELRRVVVKSMSRLEALLDDPDPRIVLMASSQLLKFGSSGMVSFSGEGEYAFPIHSDEEPPTEEEVRALEAKIENKIRLQMQVQEPIAFEEIQMREEWWAKRKSEMSGKK
jgi:DNA-binding Lrp family transcriptional regulator